LAVSPAGRHGELLIDTNPSFDTWSVVWVLKIKKTPGQLDDK